VPATIRGTDDCTVRQGSGEEVPGVMDTQALLPADGRVCGVSVGRSARALAPAAGGLARIAWSGPFHGWAE
jgi:hypothetical protein